MGMHFKLLFFSIFSLFISFSSLGQSKREPKNLKQAIIYLNEDCSDSLKAIILKTPDKDLKNLTYPKGKYRTIYNWIAEVTTLKLIEYLQKKGVENYETEVMLTAFKKYLQDGSFNEQEILKPYQDLRTKWEAEYSNRFYADSLQHIYIPKDLEDAFKQINSFWPDSTKTMVKSWTEDEFSGRLHHGFGMWMRNNWQLWGGSRLSKYFNDLGIHHPDDMSGIILDSYHRHLNNKEIQLEEQIAFYKDYWKKSEESALIKTTEEFSKYKVGDTLLFEYRYDFISKEQEEKKDNDICTATGIVTALNPKDHTIKVRLIDACDKKGIISYDNKDAMVLNPKTKKMEKPKKRIIEHLKPGKEMWFYYSDWSSKDN